MTFRLGLTGSIGMGKSTTAGMFARRGHPVWDADAAVHQLYAGAAVAPVAALYPQALAQGPCGPVLDRGALKALIAADPSVLGRLEAIVHPLVAADRAAFIARHAGLPIVVLDIPLLFETGAEAELDGVAVVSAPAELQRVRVLARAGMTPDQLALILSRQMPDSDKRARADWVIPTDTRESAEAGVDRVIADILAPSHRGPDA